jgi:uncharacterized protein (UPF0303 family)
MDIALDLQTIASQESTLVLPDFDAEQAWTLGSRLREMASSRGHKLVIDIGTFGQQLFFSALPGVAPVNLDWVRRKRNVVEHFRMSSYAVGLRTEQAGTTLSEKYGLPRADYAPFGGGFPLAVKGAGVIGTIVVSGLPQRSDHELIVEALSAALGHDYAALALRGA